MEKKFWSESNKKINLWGKICDFIGLLISVFKNINHIEAGQLVGYLCKLTSITKFPVYKNSKDDKL